MKTSTAQILLLLACSATCGGCRDTPTPGNPASNPSGSMPATPANEAAAPAAAATATMQEEREALGALNAINRHEVAVARQALDKGVTGDVADFAKLMIERHGENLDATSALGADETGDEAGIQQKAGETALEVLAQNAGSAYAIAYIDAMVKGHNEALTTLDSKLIPQAVTPAVKDHFAKTREEVAHHLERALAIQSNQRGE